MSFRRMHHIVLNAVNHDRTAQVLDQIYVFKSASNKTS